MASVWDDDCDDWNNNFLNIPQIPSEKTADQYDVDSKKPTYVPIIGTAIVDTLSICVFCIFVNIIGASGNIAKKIPISFLFDSGCVGDKAIIKRSVCKNANLKIRNDYTNISLHIKYGFGIYQKTADIEIKNAFIKDHIGIINNINIDIIIGPSIMKTLLDEFKIIPVVQHNKFNSLNVKWWIPYHNFGGNKKSLRYNIGNDYRSKVASFSIDSGNFIPESDGAIILFKNFVNRCTKYDFFVFEKDKIHNIYEHGYVKRMEILYNLETIIVLNNVKFVQFNKEFESGPNGVRLDCIGGYYLMEKLYENGIVPKID
jgi:hypothetical protein